MIRLLVVDDDEINNFLLSHILKKSGYNLQVQTFNDPVEAVGYIKQESDHIDILLLDINMPLMTGWDVLNEIRTDGESLMHHTKIYLLSSSVHSADKQKAKGYTEVSGFISKPITLEFLSEIFKEVSESKERRL